MKSVSVGTSPTLLVAAGSWNFFASVTNNSGQVVYLQYDGDSATLTPSVGVPLGIGATLYLQNPTGRQLYNCAIQGVVSAGTSDVRVQQS